MKKILFALTIMSLFACEKQQNKMRNYTYPADITNPTGTQLGAAILTYEGEPDEDIIKRVREFEYKNFSDTIQFPYIFLSTDYYTCEGCSANDVSSPNPDYMLFPHSINSISDEWGWDYFYEYMDIGEQAFCDKYLNGKRTLGMKLKSIN
tara:strand:+ start:1819 stop:2268 length:450 start_codon:yes stop_codon:yes gene_type:complete